MERWCKDSRQEAAANWLPKVCVSECADVPARLLTCCHEFSASPVPSGASRGPCAWDGVRGAHAGSRPSWQLGPRPRDRPGAWERETVRSAHAVPCPIVGNCAFPVFASEQALAPPPLLRFGGSLPAAHPRHLPGRIGPVDR